VRNKTIIAVAMLCAGLLLASPLYTAVASLPQKTSPDTSPRILPGGGFNNIFNLLLYYLFQFFQRSNQAPQVPEALYPSPSSKNVDVHTTLTWTGSDPDGDPLTYQVHLGTSSQEMTCIYTGTATSIETTLTYNQSYTWQVTASDGSATTQGALWRFTTENQLPEDKTPSPDDNKTGWTALVYLDGDNNMDSYALMELNEIRTTVLGENVTVLVLYDGRGANNSFLYVVNGSLSEIPLMDIHPDWESEVNMGHSNTLRYFVEYAFERYPAAHYWLELWSHGSGWMGVCRDEYNADVLSMQEVSNAVSAACSTHGETVDVFAYTACNMGEIECVYGLQDYVSYVVASQEYMFATGLPHGQILSQISGEHTTPLQLCSIIVDAFSTYYRYASMATIAVWDLQYMKSLARAVDEWAAACLQELAACKDHISRAYGESASFGSVGFIDLYDFMENVADEVGNTSLGQRTQQVLHNISSMVIREWHGSGQQAHGVSIYFPTEDRYVSSYAGTSFAVQTQWDEFLLSLYQHT